MTTESICSIGQHKRQQTIEAKKTTGKKEEEEDGAKGGTTKRLGAAATGKLETSGKGEEFCRTSCNKDNSTDSRSILTNKDRLKKFWEHKMELEFKLRQQQQEQQQQRQSESDLPAGGNANRNTNVASKRNSNGSQSYQQKQQQQQKLVTFDENNNNNADQQKQIDQQQENNADEEDENQASQQQQQFSDEEWRSLSPNVEPTNGTFKAMISPLKQVSAELVCEKLREYRAGNCSSGSQRLAAVAASNQTPDDKCGKLGEPEIATRDAQRANPTNGLNGAGESNSEREQQVPKVDNTHDDRYSPAKGDAMSVSNGNCNNNENLANGHLDENQLMSIDPTLCHFGANEPTSEKRERDTFYDNETAKLAEDPIACSDRTEEQTVNEEFSSSSSSYGPMSISAGMTRQLDAGNGGVSAAARESSQQRRSSAQQQQQQQQVNGSSDPMRKLASNSAKTRFDSADNTDDNDNDLSDGDETNSSAQSGSVLTVISNKQATRIEQPTNGSSFELQPTSSSDSINPNSSELGAGQDDTLTGANELSSSSTADATTNDQGDPLDDDDDSGSNIGVAFESLHFDSEIKSSKHEKVDEEMFLGPPLAQAPPAAKHRSLVPKFSANEVKSVCSFITAAISDAQRQVESCMRGSTTSGARKLADVEQQPDAVSSIQRATFIKESDFSGSPRAQRATVEPGLRKSLTSGGASRCADEADTLGDSGGDDNAGAQSDSEASVPKADLSSIFEANVRREIQRFESNSVVRRPFGAGNGGGGGKLLNKNGLTEWRIAEEIRLFNEREMELKRRLGKDGKLQQDSRESQAASTAANNQAVEPKPRHSHQSSQAVVRFGKTLQLPKAVGGDTSSSQQQPIIGQKSIKLTTVATSGSAQQQQPTTLISMHKFIASGGKRFVFTSSNTSGNSNPSQKQQLTKSMSNLSITEAGKSESQPALPMQRTVDYKAVDSLKCKETPNVRPGLTRKVIESFLRMNHESSTNSSQRSAQIASGSEASGSGGSNNCQSLSVTNNVTNFNHHHRFNQLTGHSNANVSLQPSAKSSSCSSFSSSTLTSSTNSQQPPSAELKIQEELREMRAREAELRSQRSQHSNRKSSNQSPSNDDRDSNQLMAGNSETNVHQVPTDRLSFSNESLYPIKQTIDSFRKLNNSLNQTNNNNILPMPVQQQQQNLKKTLQQSASNEQHQNNNDDYDSKVGGQRRKISMIEKWENRRL